MTFVSKVTETSAAATSAAKAAAAAAATAAAILAGLSIVNHFITLMTAYAAWAENMDCDTARYYAYQVGS